MLLNCDGAGRTRPHRLSRARLACQVGLAKQGDGALLGQVEKVVSGHGAGGGADASAGIDDDPHHIAGGARRYSPAARYISSVETGPKAIATVTSA